MIRDFTEETKYRLGKEINDINNSTWCGVTDAIGDVFLYLGKWTGIISLEDDMSNVQSYQRSVLDMTDMTKSELESIFYEVYDIDEDYARDCFDKINTCLEDYNSKMRALSEEIHPNFEISDANTIREKMAPFNAKLKSIDAEINVVFRNENSWAEDRAALKSMKGFLGSALGLVVDIATLPLSMVKGVVTGDYIGVAADTWGIIDDVFALGSNLTALSMIVIGNVAYLCNGREESRHTALKYAEAYGGAKGLTDTLKAEQEINGKDSVNETFLKISQTIDAASATYGLYSGIEGLLDGSTIKSIKKADMLEKYQGDYRHWQATYRRLNKTYQVDELKKFSKAFKYSEVLYDYRNPDEVYEGIVKTTLNNNAKVYKIAKEFGDLGEDVVDLTGLDKIQIKNSTSTTAKHTTINNSSTDKPAGVNFEFIYKKSE